MKSPKIKCVLVIMLIALFPLCIIGRGGETEVTDNTDFTVSGDSVADGIYEFYYTYENINYNASYLRYLIYIEDKVPYLYFEKRERPNEYGPATEEDITAQGTVRLNEDQWNTFSSFIEEGTYGPKKDNALSGDSGPWTYIYFQKSPKKQLEFRFESWDRLAEFEEFCASLAGITEE